MKNTILFLAMLLFINFTNAQEQKESYYNYAKANLEETGKIDKNGFPTGEWSYYLESGSLDYIINWETNYIKKYYVTGELKEKGTFIPETGVHIKEWVTYYKNGQVKEIVLYNENGDKNGEFKSYFENGTLKSVEVFKNGVSQK